MRSFGSTVLMLLAITVTARAASAPPVTSLAYRPDGKLLAVGVRGEVALVDPATGNIRGRLTGFVTSVTALAWNRDGSQLAVASGKPGQAGQIDLVATPNAGAPTRTRSFVAHADRIPDLAFHPDGTTLASCSYDRLVKLWDTTSNRSEAKLTLKDHSDSVYGVAFRPDGKLLATVAADRTIKIWDVATGTRLYSLGDPTDWVYAVAWHPDGKRLAAAGVDKSLRVWAITEKEGTLLRSAFAHEKAVLRLAVAQNGNAIWSMSEDRTVKAWNFETLAEIKVHAAQRESVLAFAIHPDGKQFALGRYDGACLLVDSSTGKPGPQPLPEKPKPPKVDGLKPNAGRLGQSVTLAVSGEHLAPATEVLVSPAGLEAKLLPGGDGASRRVVLKIPPGATPGSFQVKLKSPTGESNSLEFYVDRFETKMEPAGNDAPATAPPVSLQTSFVGSLDRAGDVDYYRFELTSGQEVGVQVQGRTGGKLEPVLMLTDAVGNSLRESTSGSLGYRASRPGVYTLGVRDREYRGGSEFSYRLHLGEIPIVTSFAPLGVQRGQTAIVHLDGVFLPPPRQVKVHAPTTANIGSKIPVPVGGALNAPSLVVGEFPSAMTGQVLPIPGTGQGVIAEPGQTGFWRFSAKKGQPLVVEVDARRSGSELDSVIEILDSQRRPVERAVLRSFAKTYVTFRDHDSVAPGIRMETWNEFAIDDYVLVGQELMRIRSLPRNPDDDCQFYAVNGARKSWLGTTPSHHALGTPMLKVGVFPPGTLFPPNGLPVVSLTYRNDDGGAGFGKDSYLRFDPPADGEYQIRIGDARGQGGPEFGYRVTVRPPRPDYSIRFSPTAPSVWKGGAIPITVTADRFDDFDGPISIKLDRLPAGFRAPATFIEAGQLSTTFALYAEPGAVVKGELPVLTASAEIEGRTVKHEAPGGAITLVEPSDIVTTAAASSVTIRPGQEARLTVSIERRNGFKGRIPLDVMGLPHGVRVLNVGLNGILVTERDTSREIVLYAEPWVKPLEHPIVVLARREGKNTEHAAPSVLLKVAKP